MLLILVILFLFSVATWLLNLSLIEKKLNVVLNIIFLGVTFVLTQLTASEINTTKFSELLSSYELMAGIAAYQIAESLIKFILIIQLINGRLSKSSNRFLKLLSLTPPVVFLLGLLAVEIFLFNNIHGYSYLLLAVIFSTAVMVLGIVGYFLTKAIIKQWELRIELSALITLFQIALAMFLPVLLLGIDLNGKKIEYNYLSTIYTIVVMLFVLGSGYLNHKYGFGEKLWKRLTTFFT
ncbi:MAG: hypothetical protein ACEPO8_12400 [Rhodothermaceae bacterium]